MMKKIAPRFKTDAAYKSEPLVTCKGLLVTIVFSFILLLFNTLLFFFFPLSEFFARLHFWLYFDQYTGWFSLHRKTGGKKVGLKAGC